MKTAIKHNGVAYYSSGEQQGSDYKHYIECREGWVVSRGRNQGSTSLFFNTLREFKYQQPVKKELA